MICEGGGVQFLWVELTVWHFLGGSPSPDKSGVGVLFLAPK